MSEPLPPELNCAHYHAELPVSDVQAAADFYTKKLGFQPGFYWGEPPSMAAVNLGEMQIFLQKTRCRFVERTP